jgi:hypothetical protein
MFDHIEVAGPMCVAISYLDTMKITRRRLSLPFG